MAGNDVFLYSVPAGNDVTLRDPNNFNSDVSVALSGLPLSVSSGSVVLGLAISVSGREVSTSQEALAPSVSMAATGLAVSVSQGAIAPSASVGIAGQSATAAASTLTAAFDRALTGQALAAAQGAVAIDLRLGVSGFSLAVAHGDVIATSGIFVALSGQSLSISVGAIGYGIDYLWPTVPDSTPPGWATAASVAPPALTVTPDANSGWAVTQDNEPGTLAATADAAPLEWALGA